MEPPSTGTRPGAIVRTLGRLLVFFTLLFTVSSTRVVSTVSCLELLNENMSVSPPSKAGYRVYSKVFKASLTLETVASKLIFRSYRPVEEPNNETSPTLPIVKYPAVLATEIFTCIKSVLSKSTSET